MPSSAHPRALRRSAGSGWVNKVSDRLGGRLTPDGSTRPKWTRTSSIAGRSSHDDCCHGAHWVKNYNCRIIIVSAVEMTGIAANRAAGATHAKTVLESWRWREAEADCGNPALGVVRIFEGGR
jgi:hypothetical protein